MALILLGAPKGTNTIIRLDDPSLFADEGAAIPEPYFVTADVDFGPAGGEGRLRQIIQAVTTGGMNAMRVTPIANGGEVTDQAESFTLDSSEGAEQRVEHAVASVGTRHAIKVSVETVEAALAFGECDLVLVPRRSRERA